MNNRFSTLRLTKKTEPKKTFSINNNNEFPVLSKTNNNDKTKMCFANATKRENKAKVIDVPDVLPGWVHIRSKNCKVEYKYGKISNRYFDHNADNDRIQSLLMFKYRVERDQYEIDNDIARLGDLSEYYGQQRLSELYEEEERLINSEERHYSESEEYNEVEEYNDSSTYNYPSRYNKSEYNEIKI
jgi:hypothetical protein